jgi:hypothetical protein
MAKRPRPAAALLIAGIFMGFEARAETFELANGDKVSGEVLESDAERIVLSHPVFGRLEIPLAQIVSAPEDTGVFGSGFLVGWTRRIGLGFSGSEGNSEKAAVNTDLTLSYEDDHKRWLFNAAYFFGSSEGTTDTSRAFVNLERDWKLEESAFYFFARGGYDFDDFRGFKHRVAGNGGVGYWWLRWEHWKLGNRLGAGASYQWQDESQFRPEAVLGLDSVWTIAKGHTFEIHGDVFPDLSDLFEYRTRTAADWNIALGETTGLGLAVGAIHEYVSDTDLEKHDVTYRGLVTYGF